MTIQQKLRYRKFLLQHHWGSVLLSEVMSEPTPVQPKQRRKRRRSTARRVKKLPPFNVVLLDDDDHTYDYVIEMMKAVFGYPKEKGILIADEVNNTGRVIVFTSHKELAELKRDQMQGYGADWRIPACKGAMTATVEPAA